jgi:CelD/BcsL family acetyltransferase involved in cellulose biosynthesis
MKEYSRHGELLVEQPSSVFESLVWFDALEVLHQRRWISKGEPGCFSNPRFVKFHRMMIARNNATGGVVLLRIIVGNSTLGYIYGFSDAQRFYVYQCGFDYELVERNSMPGLVSHVMAMRFLAAKGLKYYDFMAGSSGYKSALSNVEESMTWTVFRSDAIRFRAIDYLRSVVSKMHEHKCRIMTMCRAWWFRVNSPLPCGTPVNQGA